MVTSASLNISTPGQGSLLPSRKLVQGALNQSPFKAAASSSAPVSAPTPKENTQNLPEQDHNEWKLRFSNILEPKVFFNKILNKVLYPFKKASRSDFDKIFQELQAQNIPLKKHLVKTKDDQLIELWFAKNPDPEAVSKIYLHGNASNIGYSAKDAASDYKQGYSICLFSYRGYSGNEGYPSEEGLKNDTHAVIDFVVQNQNIKSKPIDVQAYSLGSAVSIHSLAESPYPKFGELVLMAPFKSMRDMVKCKTKIFPQFIINKLTNIWNNYEALPLLKNKVKKITILHGTHDRLIPIKQSEDLYKLALSHGIPSEFIQLKGIGHKNIKRDLR